MAMYDIPYKTSQNDRIGGMICKRHLCHFLSTLCEDVERMLDRRHCRNSRVSSGFRNRSRRVPRVHVYPRMFLRSSPHDTNAHQLSYLQQWHMEFSFCLLAE